MSLLYECINGIIQGGILDGEDGLQERDEVATLCVGKLRGMIVMDTDPNREFPVISRLDISSLT
jgi:AP-3 complex subunit delta-1